jgi:polyferredoxin
MKRWIYYVKTAIAAATLLLALAVFSGFWPLKWWLDLHPGPALSRLLVCGVLGAALALGAMALLAVLGGRWYCSVLCPLGILQDGAAKLAHSGVLKTQRKVLRYAVALAVWGLALCGWNLLLRLMEPFSIVGSALSMAWGGLLALALIVLASLWKRRLYCAQICPVGTLLGLCSRSSLFTLRLSKEKCLHCGLCRKNCPAAAIDPDAFQVDDEHCLRCLTCLKVCPSEAIAWGRRSFKAAPVDSRRRQLLTCGMAALASGILAVGARKLAPKAPPGEPLPICPPGAETPWRFAALCANCGVCVAHCQGKVLRPGGLFRPVHLDYSLGMCEFNCNTCSQLCPFGALQPLAPAEKKRRRIGMAHFEPWLCVAVEQKTPCGACAEHCPTGALRMVQGEHDACPVPVLTEDLCIGCGNCEYPCPVRPLRAIRVQGIEAQSVALDPVEFFRSKEQTAPEPSGDDWLL